MKWEDFQSPRLQPTRPGMICILILSGILLLGFFIRFDDLYQWRENPEAFFSSYDGTPVTRAVDSYYYLAIANDLLAGKVAAKDTRRRFPGSYEKPVSLPILSLLLAMGTRISRLPPEWTAIFLPTVLGPLLAIPVFFLTIQFLRPSSSNSGTRSNSSVPLQAAGLAAALFAVVSPAFVERSSLGWCDTDILNVTLLGVLTVAALRAGMAESSRELAFSLASFTLFSVLYLFWWDQATGPVFAFSLGYLLLAALMRLVRGKDGLFFFLPCLVLILLFLLLLTGTETLSLPGKILSMISYSLSRDGVGPDFLRAGQLVAEQQDVSFSVMTGKIAATPWALFPGLAGLLLLFFFAGTRSLFLLPWLALAFLSFHSHRLMIFLTVPMALGAGTLIFFLGGLIRRKRLLAMLVGACLIAWPSLSRDVRHRPAPPKRSPLLYDGFRQLADRIPGDSVIWASWGHGHPLVYFTGASVIGDGIFHPPELVFTQYVPYAAAHERLAANWIKFYTRYGLDGLRRANLLLAGDTENWKEGMRLLQKLLGNGIEKSRQLLTAHRNLAADKVEELLEFLFPFAPAPIFFLLDQVSYDEQWYTWGTLARTDGGAGGYTMVPFSTFTLANDRLVAGSSLGDISIDLRAGFGRIGNTAIRLKQVYLAGDTVPRYHQYAMHPLLYTLLLRRNKLSQFGAVVDDGILNTVFTRIFFMDEHDPTFFKLVQNNSPLYSLYQVGGDVYTSTPSPGETGKPR
ncbi:MAG: hypothetical protein Kow0089_17640 [Desulfobulbaceae bacterium]